MMLPNAGVKVVHQGLAVVEEARAVVQSMVTWLGRRLGGRCQQICDLLDASCEVHLGLLAEAVPLGFGVLG